MIIGITGTFAAGKGTIVDYLVRTQNFKHLSVRSFLTKILKKRKQEISIKNLADLGNELRKKYGSDYIASELYEEASRSKRNTIIESLRAPAEINLLKSKNDFYLFAIDAKPKIRFERMKSRAQAADNLTFKKFVAEEKKQMNSRDPNKQNIKKCITMADYKFENNGTLKDLENQIEKTLADIKAKNAKYIRPSWDDYFFEVMNAISKRATCDRARTGSIAVLNNQILVTGYVGAPKGFPHCDEIGHELKKALHDDGTITQHCVRTVHGEQNLICQAAKKGIPIEGATIYTRMTPCRVCAMLLVNCGIKKVYCERKYHTGAESEQIFKKAKIKLVYKYNEIQKYKNM